MTATAPASSATRACSTFITSAGNGGGRGGTMVSLK
eukprot:CAMPEP_0118885022 /NCGR_PEP_ID=MMETSP1163-20130328/23660_1 /TAXON_ID=124430 /ORGANISM="Phaeomonas parva, Strain CCMP2877" /LENGTH=35 /DNA_ID= /DNA_START= /DNA_END= /DNA_ORIENTATION=